jgi:N-acetylglucosaminyldiphosphoundecaprenol N-acetyl-beta-D-mannosaminyltransferase
VTNAACAPNGKVYNAGYHRKTDKTAIPVCTILGVDIAAVNMAWFIRYVTENIGALSGDYVCVTCVHSIVMAYERPDYAKCQNGGIAAVADGGSLSSLSQKRGYREAGRITGPDLMAEVMRISAAKGYRHYFYGSSEETLGKLNQRLQEQYPGLQVAGMYSPPFRMLTQAEDNAVMQRINEARADFVWVGLGAPKQEVWMANHQGKVNGLMVGVGAGFDYLAGNIDRAPQWMQRLHLEWLYRVFQDPGRLAGRYLHAVPKLFWNAYIRGR